MSLIVHLPSAISKGLSRMGALLFIVAVGWGSLSAQFLVQIFASLIVSGVYTLALPFSKVPKTNNLGASAVSLIQAVLFGVIFIAGNWFVSDYVDFGSWNADSTASLIAFLLTLAYCAVQVPGKLLLARMCAWEPYFLEASMAIPPAERVAFARKHRQDRTA